MSDSEYEERIVYIEDDDTDSDIEEPVVNSKGSRKTVQLSDSEDERPMAPVKPPPKKAPAKSAFKSKHEVFNTFIAFTAEADYHGLDKIFTDVIKSFEKKFAHKLKGRTDREKMVLLGENIDEDDVDADGLNIFDTFMEQVLSGNDPTDDDDDGSEPEVKPAVVEKKKKQAVPAKTKAKSKPTTNVVEAQVDAEEDASTESTDNGKRRVKTPVERVDLIIDMLDKSGVTKKVVEELLKLRRQLDGAKIKKSAASSSESKRPPSTYNLFMREKMAELKDNGMTPKMRFAECIRMWNEAKKKNSS